MNFVITYRSESSSFIINFLNQLYKKNKIKYDMYVLFVVYF